MAAHNGIQRGAVGVLPYDVSYCADTAFYGLHGCTYVCEVEQNYGKYNIKIDEGK